jgi:hypothetical protein
MANYNGHMFFRKADGPAFLIFKVTEPFLKAERLGLTSQIYKNKFGKIIDSDYKFDVVLWNIPERSKKISLKL